LVKQEQVRNPREGLQEEVSRNKFPGTGQGSQEQVPRFPARVPKPKFSGTGPFLKYDMIMKL
jgi:hypothetical protein